MTLPESVRNLVATGERRGVYGADDKLIDSEVYFGWDLPRRAPVGGFIVSLSEIMGS